MSKIKMLADLVSGEDLLPDSQMTSFSPFSHNRRSEGVLWGPFRKGTNPQP